MELENHQRMLKLVGKNLRRKWYLYSLKILPPKSHANSKEASINLTGGGAGGGGNLADSTLTKRSKLTSPLVEETDLMCSEKDTRSLLWFSFQKGIT